MDIDGAVFTKKLFYFKLLYFFPEISRAYIVFKVDSFPSSEGLFVTGSECWCASGGQRISVLNHVSTTGVTHQCL